MVTKSKFQTQKLAIRLAKKILTANRPERKRGATIIALSGNLGSGKTTFTQGFMKALGVEHHITSPTFVIMRKYSLSILGSRTSSSEVRLPRIKFQFVYHLDLYRINKVKEILSLGFKKIISDPQNIVLIEWPEVVRKILPKNTIWVKFEHGKKKSERIIKIRTTQNGWL